MVHLTPVYYRIILLRIMYIMLNRKNKDVKLICKYHLDYPYPPQFATLVPVKRFL
ncbi:hypothetical protein A28LD_0856 [Idiomarina sp. A28L]|nr:hypothetical protein A28LD_0856 [Idiomarina sp. A28L]